MRYTMRLAPLAALAVIGVAHVAVAARRCEKPCKAETTGCIADRCTGLGGQARRECIETCRGIGGCAPIRTMAYVVTELRSDGQNGHQALRVQRGNCAPATVMELPLPTAPEQLAFYSQLFPIYVDHRFGGDSTLAGFFQRLAVTPDGSGVIFEVTDDVATIFQLSANIEEGFYYVRADGSAPPRRIGPQSGVPRFVPGFVDFGSDNIPDSIPVADISPNGRTFVFTDLGPDPAGERAIQIVTLDIATGKRTVVTHFPIGGTEHPRFVDNDTILFLSSANPEGLNPDRYDMFFTVNVDGTALRAIGTPTASASSRVLPRFSLWRGGTNLMNMVFFDSSGKAPQFDEVFILDGTQLIQLTNFGLLDTSRLCLSRDGRRAFFRAHADPLGTNPSENCQLFSIDTRGAHLRQLTAFREGDGHGCRVDRPPPGCSIGEADQDPATGEVVFYSSCDPLGTNPYGGQLFAMRPDGTKLRQLTATRGRTVDNDGVVSVALPGPWAYSARPR